MPRLELEFPSATVFKTDIEIDANFINRGDHVGNHHFVELSNNVAMMFFRSRGATEFMVGEQKLINAELAVKYFSEAKLGDVLIVELGANNFHRCGCDIYIQFSQKETTAPVALAKLSFLTFDYQKAEVVSADQGFKPFFTRND